MIASASRLARQALHLKPIGTPYAGDPTRCAMCATGIAAGDIVAPAKFPRSFCDHLDLRPSSVICGDCSATTNQTAMRALQRSVVTEQHVYPIGSDDHRAWFLTTPPAPPFAAFIQTRSAIATYHLHWKTPVTIDSRLITVRLDHRLLKIRQPVLMEAIGVCSQLADAIQDRRAVKKRRAALHHPFVALDRALEDPAHGVLHPDCTALPPEFADRRKWLLSLWPGELWALATLAKAKPATPTQPEPLVLK
jgi:CRISPR type IV-associated protein Csf1